nr:hypothetical protein [Azonexus sp.]
APLSKLHATRDDENNASLSLNDSPDCSHEFIPDSSARRRESSTLFLMDSRLRGNDELISAPKKTLNS